MINWSLILSSQLHPAKLTATMMCVVLDVPRHAMASLSPQVASVHPASKAVHVMIDLS